MRGKEGFPSRPLCEEAQTFRKKEEPEGIFFLAGGIPFLEKKETLRNTIQTLVLVGQPGGGGGATRPYRKLTCFFVGWLQVP